MFCIKIKGTEVCLSFSFFAIVGLVCLYQTNSMKILIILSCCILHESGHLCAMCIYGLKPVRVTFYGGGIKITPDLNRISSQSQDIVILSGGCAVNFLLAFVGYAVSGMCFFVSANLLLGAFNLLPFRYFDGGKMLEKIISSQLVNDIVRSIFILLIASLTALSALSGQLSLSLITVLGYICLSEEMSVR